MMNIQPVSFVVKKRNEVLLPGNMVPKSNMSAIKNKGSFIKGKLWQFAGYWSKSRKILSISIMSSPVLLDFAKLKYLIQLVHCAIVTPL